jgi:hypothetical protein
MTQDRGRGRPWSQANYGGFGDGPGAEQDHIRKLAARQRERAACMRAEAAELRSRNRLLRPAWPPASNGAIQPIQETVGTDRRSPADSCD